MRTTLWSMSVCMLGGAVGAWAQPAFWPMVEDWVPGPVAGTSDGNPHAGTSGMEWRYEWIQSGDGIYGESPWYRLPSHLMTWNPNHTSPDNGVVSPAWEGGGAFVEQERIGQRTDGPEAVSPVIVLSNTSGRSRVVTVGFSTMGYTDGNSPPTTIDYVLAVRPIGHPEATRSVVAVHGRASGDPHSASTDDFVLCDGEEFVQTVRCFEPVATYFVWPRFYMYTVNSVCESAVWDQCPGGISGVSCRVVRSAQGGTPGIPDRFSWTKDGAPVTPGATPWGSRIEVRRDSPLVGSLLVFGFQAEDVGSYVGHALFACDAEAEPTNASYFTFCAVDYNCDHFLDFFDYDAFVEGYEAGDQRADFNHDGFLDFFDYDGFVEAFEEGC